MEKDKRIEELQKEKQMALDEIARLNKALNERQDSMGGMGSFLEDMMKKTVPAIETLKEQMEVVKNYQPRKMTELKYYDKAIPLTLTHNHLVIVKFQDPEMAERFYQEISKAYFNG